jgi:hypothetical protein
MVARFRWTLVTAGACSEGWVVLFSWSNSGGATSWNSLGGRCGLECQRVAAHHVVAVAWVSVLADENWSNPAPIYRGSCTML